MSAAERNIVRELTDDARTCVHAARGEPLGATLPSHVEALCAAVEALASAVDYLASECMNLETAIEQGPLAVLTRHTGER